MRTIHLYLVRHGETVDNVAQLYAGRRDSILTNHGHLQASRLGQYFKDTDVIFSHFFSSTLKRAFQTADLVRSAQDGPLVVQLPELIEQDFGSLEGVSWTSKLTESSPRKSTSPQSHEKSQHIPSETKEEMDRRADSFIDEHIIPLTDTETSASPEPTKIAVVSHGIILSRLWKRILQRMERKSVSIAPEITSVRPVVALEHLGRWDNTGFLKLRLSKPFSSAEEQAVNGVLVPTSAPVAKLDAVEADTREIGDMKGKVDHSEVATSDAVASSGRKSVNTEGLSVASRRPFLGWGLLVEAINSREHLVGLKRTRGVGSAGHDDKQKNIQSFFKRQKTS